MLKMTRFVSKIILAAVIILLGVVVSLLMDETRGLALADLPNTPVRAVSAAPDGVLYVGLTSESWPAGLYRSEDNGRTWQAAAAELNVPITALAADPADPSVLYAGTEGGSLFKTSSLWSSRDSGGTWRRFVAPLPANPDGMLPAVTALVVDPANPQILYAGTDGHGIYRYDLARNGYELLGDFTLREAQVKEVAVGPEGQVYALTGDGLFVTGNGTWRQLKKLPDGPVTLAVAAGQPARLYLGTASSGAYRSDDGGRSWEWLGQELGMLPGADLRVTALAVDERDPAHVVVATAHGVEGRLMPAGVYESLDAGQHWTRLEGPEVSVSTLILRGGAAYAATTGGLVRYGEPATSAPLALPLLGGLALSGSRLLILVLAVTLAGLALLVNWERWLSEPGDQPAGRAQ